MVEQHGSTASSRAEIRRWGEAVWVAVASSAVALAVGGLVYSGTHGHLSDPCRGEHPYDVRLLATVGLVWAGLVLLAPQVVLRGRGRIVGVAVGVVLALLPTYVVAHLLAVGHLECGGCD